MNKTRSTSRRGSRRPPREQRGSVLILVVALLVLMALIGTAFITSAASDRESSVQHRYNTEVELLVDGVKQLASNAIVSKVAQLDNPLPYPGGANSFRPATPAVALAGAPAYPVAHTPTSVSDYYSHLDYAGWDAYLADRYPTRGGANIFWNYISANPLATQRDPANPDYFPNQFQSPLVGGGLVSKFGSRRNLIPTFTSVTIGSNTRVYPAFRITDPNDPANGQNVLAGDADGDGIADGGYVEFPFGQIDGVKYYFVTRIIDNGAALNVSTAWENTAGAVEERARLPVDITPANIDIRRILEGTDGSSNQFNITTTGTFNSYRFGDGSTTAAVVRPGGMWSPSASPIKDDRAADGNFRFATRYDAFWTQLGSRLDNPGYNTTTAKYRALGLGESSALAYRFCLANPLGSQSVLEQYFPIGTRLLPAINRTTPYAANDINNWFGNIFDYDSLAANVTPVRPLVVGHNSTSNFVQSFTGNSQELNGPSTGANPVADELQRAGQYRYRGSWNAATLYHIGEWVRAGSRSYVAFANHTGLAPGTPQGNVAWAEAPWTNHPVKINPNTANFGSLMAAYYAVMADAPEIKPGGTTETGYNNAAGIFTFGNVYRDNRVLTARMVKQLRAALAAVNTIDLRDYDNDVTSRQVTLRDDNGSNEVRAMVYGTERQLFITEAVVHIGRDGRNYIAVELYNPHPVGVSMSPYRVAWRSRNTPGTPTLIGPLVAGTVPAFGYAYLESDPGMRPPGMRAVPTTRLTPLPGSTGLESLITGGDKELLLLRTRQANGAVTNSADQANPFNEASLTDLVPADVLEFVGITPGFNVAPDPADPLAPPVPVSDRFHYRRATAIDAGNFVNPWHSVYAGPYNRAPVADGSYPQGRRQFGWVRDPRPTANPAGGPPMERLTDPGWGSKTRANPEPARNDGTYTPGQATFRTRTLQVNAEGMPGPWKPSATVNNNINPYGGFTRIGDLLAVTYVGAYRIGSGTDPSAAEMNSVSVDSAFAEDGDKADDDGNSGSGASNPVEQLGRFCPIRGVAGIDDMSLRPGPVNAPIASHRYAWATDIFDYFTVHCPQDDYMANVDPVNNDPTVPGSSTKWRGGTMPQATANGPSVTNYNSANRGREDTASVQGLINLNTANWKVISCLPFTTNPTTNIQIAREIVAYRAANGPFRNLFDLMKVPNFENRMGSAATLNPGLAEGDLTPLNSTSSPGLVSSNDNVAGDFEARYLMINRISNMVSFRSDSFTVYVLVQGWRNAGTTAPELVVQRRAAMIVDRAAVRPDRGPSGAGNMALTPARITNVPNN